jgi:hypothetical protein
MAQASNVSFSINVGGPPIVIEQPPEFLYPAELGFGVAVGVPYDMFYLSGIYYVYRGGGWYRTDAYGGHWIKVRHRDLPYSIRRHRINRIHEFRDREHRIYVRDRDHYREHYRGRYFRPGVAARHERREERREIRHERREDRRDMRGDRRDDRRERREDRRDDRQERREERREHR